MPDITLCVNSDCPLRITCKRYADVNSQSSFQSYIRFEPRKHGDSGKVLGCEHYTEKPNVRREIK